MPQKTILLKPVDYLISKLIAMSGKKIAGLIFIALFALSANAQQPNGKKNINSRVTDVWVVFKTHFDLGFTDLPENVFKRYREEMMDNALMIIEKSQTLPEEKRFAWTVSGWPLQAQILGPLQTPEHLSFTGFLLPHIQNHWIMKIWCGVWGFHQR